MSHEIFNADKILKKNSLINAGLTDSELTRPLVIILCEQGCHAAVEHIKHGVISSGCAALVIDMPALSDMAAEGASKGTLLFARESAADITEAILSMYSADGAAIVASSQAAAAGMIMGAVRHNIPLVFLPAFFTGAYYPSRLINMRAAVNCGKAGITELEDLQCGISFGRTMEMDNLNSLCIFLEGCGIAVKDSVGAFSADEKIHKARKCGELAAKRAAALSYPRKDLTIAAIDCGLAAYIAAGGTAAALLDILAIANENQLGLDLKHIENISSKLPLLVAVAPFGKHCIPAFVRAGGVFAVLKELLKIPKLLSPSVKIGDTTLVELLGEAEIISGTSNPRGSEGMHPYTNSEFSEKSNGSSGSFSETENPEVITPLESPVLPEGGFALLKGNLFDYGVFSRRIKEKIFKGTAAVFDSEEQFRAAVFNSLIKEGTAVVIRGQSARDNGMPLLDLQSAVRTAGLSAVVIITDGRSLETGGCAVISLCCGATLTTVKNGDLVEIDFKKCKINLNIASKEINTRLKKLKNIDELLTGGLLKYSYLVGEPDNGCIIKQKF